MRKIKKLESRLLSYTLYVANPFLWVQDREWRQICQYPDPLYCLTWRTWGEIEFH